MVLVCRASNAISRAVPLRDTQEFIFIGQFSTLCTGVTSLFPTHQTLPRAVIVGI